MKTTLAIAGAILCASITSTVAQAGDIPSTVAWAGDIPSTVARTGDLGGPRAVRVQVADLDLASSAGQARLDRRLKRAVAEVCGTPTALRIDSHRQHDSCRAETAAAAAIARDRLLAASAGRQFVVLR
jgi:UrcA family protein